MWSYSLERHQLHLLPDPACFPLFGAVRVPGIRASGTTPPMRLCSNGATTPILSVGRTTRPQMVHKIRTLNSF